MNRILEYLLGSASFVPHGYCLLWRPDLVALHAVSDIGIAGAYFAIPLGIMVFASRREDMTREATQIAILFSAFIILCGITHLGGLMTLWHPYYGLDGVVKALTAVVSIMTAIVAWRLMPQLAAIPSPRQVALMAEHVVEASSSRERAYLELDEARRNLERQVEERTRELSAAKQIFEAATRGAQITIFSQDRNLTYTWVHNPWFEMADTDIIGKTDEDVFPEPVRTSIIAVKRRVLEGGVPETFEAEVPHGELKFWFRFDVTPLREEDGSVVGIVSTAIDISRGKRLEEMRADLSNRLSETVQRFDLALRSSEIVVFSQDENLRYTWSNSNDTQVGPIVGRTDYELLEEPDLSRIVSLKMEAMAEREPRSGEVRVVSDGDVRWYDLFIEPNISDDGAVTGITCSAVDISAMKRDEEQMRLVMRELTHRSKNLLAVVQAIARQTAQRADTVPDFLNTFGERLRALAGAQDLLVAENWAGARLDQLIQAQVGHYMPQDQSRVVVTGPELTMTPEATQVLALALHELATNAAKYGALSNDVGTVSVTWSVGSSDEGAVVSIEWREEGGPTVAPPSRRGFGSVVVESNVSRSLDAKVALEFPSDGVRAGFIIPAKHFTSSVAT